MEINNEKEFRKFVKKLKKENKITNEECEALINYVSGIFDALDGMYGIKESNLD